MTIPVSVTRDQLLDDLAYTKPLLLEAEELVPKWQSIIILNVAVESGMVSWSLSPSNNVNEMSYSTIADRLKPYFDDLDMRLAAMKQGPDGDIFKFDALVSDVIRLWSMNHVIGPHLPPLTDEELKRADLSQYGIPDELRVNVAYTVLDRYLPGFSILVVNTMFGNAILAGEYQNMFVGTDIFGYTELNEKLYLKQYISALSTDTH